MVPSIRVSMVSVMVTVRNSVKYRCKYGTLNSMFATKAFVFSTREIVINYQKFLVIVNVPFIFC